MLRLLFLLSILLHCGAGFSQPAKKTANKEQPPSQSDMNKMMEDAMKGMSEDEKAEMRKMMKDVMPTAASKPAASVASFTDNKVLVPQKDVNRISTILKKNF